MNTISEQSAKRSKEYATKADVKEIVKDAVEELGQMLSRNFDFIYKKFDRIEGRLDSMESIMATKQDIRNVFDKTVSNHRFDELTGRVVVLEEKVNK